LYWRVLFLAADAAITDATVDLELEAEFVRACPPEVRRLHGVYFTPREVVGAQVRLVEGVLRDRLGCPTGFADERVLIIDPACGTGAYPLEILSLTGDVRERMHLFESLPGPAAIARERGLPVDERDALTANLDDRGAPIVVCLGNPPYRRRTSSAVVSLDDFSQGDHGVHRKNLHNDYVYFWRWALRAACEARRGPAIICFITAASYVRGPAFVGMRRTLRRALDELWLIDLEGDQRAARASANVFPIRTPVAIALGVRYGDASPAAPASVHYTRLSGTSEQKLTALDAISEIEALSWQPAPNTWDAVMHASPPSTYWSWPALTELFPFQASGAQLKRTWPIGVTPEVLRARWRQFVALPTPQRREAFAPSRDRDIDSTPTDLFNADVRLQTLASVGADTACAEPVRYAYRPFDRQWVLPDARLADFPRPSLWRIVGPRQVFVTSMLTNVLGPGPAAVATRHVPDLDHFRGSFGARGVIPLWLDAAGTRPNVSHAWLARLSQIYGLSVDAEQLLAYGYAVLAAPSYTRRFAEELRTPGPRVPLPIDGATFSRGAKLGQRLLDVQTYRRVASGRARVQQGIGEAVPMRSGYDAAQASVWLGEGFVGPVGQEVWGYSVSGYHVISNWLRRRLPRRGRRKSPLDAVGPTRWDPSLTHELLELVWLVEATVELGPELDQLLGDACVKPVRVTEPPRN
jgi:predicted helicase